MAEGPYLQAFYLWSVRNDIRSTFYQDQLGKSWLFHLEGIKGKRNSPDCRVLFVWDPWWQEEGSVSDCHPSDGAKWDWKVGDGGESDEKKVKQVKALIQGCWTVRVCECELCGTLTTQNQREDRSPVVNSSPNQCSKEPRENRTAGISKLTIRRWSHPELVHYSTFRTLKFVFSKQCLGKGWGLTWATNGSQNLTCRTSVKPPRHKAIRARLLKCRLEREQFYHTDASNERGEPICTQQQRRVQNKNLLSIWCHHILQLTYCS